MEREFRYFRLLRTDEEAITRAALAQLPSGKRHPHQYRVPRVSLEESCDRLVANLPRLRATGAFDDLLDEVDMLVRPIPKIGELAVYDTALRIGARFGLEPEKVYVHAGTRDGAHALGFDRRLAVIEMDELPVPIQQLPDGRQRTSFAATRTHFAARGLDTFRRRFRVEIPHPGRAGIYVATVTAITGSLEPRLELATEM